MKRSILFCAAVLFSSASCSRPVQSSGAAQSADASAPSVESAAKLPAPATPSGAASVAAPAAKSPVAYSGKYKSVPSTIYVPDQKDWSGVKVRGDDAGAGVGEGTLSLTVDATGRVLGTSDAAGAIGEVMITGMLDGAALTATISRKNPADQGFTGTLFAKASGDTLEGTMKLAMANAAVAREATFSAKKN